MQLLASSDPSAIAKALEILHRGGIVAHATETCYGFACDLRDKNIVTRLFALKQRGPDQPVSALFASVEEAKKYVQWSDRAEELAKEHLPGPLTLILPQLPRTPFKLFLTPLKAQSSPFGSAQGKQLKASIGLRISSHPLARNLVTAFGSPLSTTSANLHGQPNPYSAEDIIQQFEKQELQPDLILDSGTLPPTPPSTVINLAAAEGDERILRKGTA